MSHDLRPMRIFAILRICSQNSNQISLARDRSRGATILFGNVYWHLCNVEPYRSYYPVRAYPTEVF